MLQSLIRFFKLHRISLLFALGSLLFYFVFAYLLDRDDFIRLLTLYAALFFFCYQLIRFQKWNFNFLLIIGILFRLLFLLAEPNLSQDFYRFIWDGELIKNGINPYLYTPNQLLHNPDFQIPNATALFDGMGELSAKHYSNYPPINQLFFTISAFLGGGSIVGAVIVFRGIIILADIGIILLGKKLLQHFNLPLYTLFWYFLNPLVVIELTGNLHFEGTMLFFFIAAIYFIAKEKWWLAAPLYAASIMVKLVPILFLPFFLKYFGFKKSILFYLLTLVCCLLYLTPFYSEQFIGNYGETLALWFSNFEFNASVYNLVKFIGTTYFEAKPWELVKSYGKLVPMLTLVFAFLLFLKQKNKDLPGVLTASLYLLTFYFLISSTVHPWYLVFPVMLSVFTPYRYAIIWSATVILSYYAYSNANFTENLWLLFIEYFVVVGYLIYEFVKLKPISAIFREKNNR